MKRTGISRRSFLTGLSATAATVTILPQSVFGANDKVNLACIGCGGKGDSDINDAVSRGANIVALCDANEGPVNGQAKRFPNARKFSDFRKLFDAMEKDIDAVTVSTPDHTHFPASMAAIMLGKHAFCQKPLVHTVWEARRIAQAAREKKVATQMGIQGHANDGARQLCEWIWGGAIGQVTEVHYCTNRPGGWWPQPVTRPTDTPPVPANLDWDCWLNAAPARPYHPCYLPAKWRGWWDFGCGALGDIGCHVMDAAFWALDFRVPESIEAEVSGLNPEGGPKWSIVTYQFPARGPLPPVKLKWYDGVSWDNKNGWEKEKGPPRPKELPPEQKLPGETYCLIYGDKGTILQDFYCGGPRVIPEAKMKEVQELKIPKTLPRAPRTPAPHMEEYLQACKGGPPAGANFEYAASLSEMEVLGNLTVRLGKKIEWDAKNMKVTNLPEANKYLRCEPRKGWEQYYTGADVPPQPEPQVGPPAK
ncbi:MAG: Gfo/Idh/MocA family oxidoreductase [Planctomycetota bacterium]